MPEAALPAEHTAAEAASLLASGECSAQELTRYYLDRIARLNPELNAVLALDSEGALAAAAASDERRRSGAALSPLDGVPVLVKDNIEAIGLPGCAGSRALLGSPAARDSEVAARLRAAGLVLLGSTNLSEWANFRSTASTSGWSAVGGQTRNPHDRQRNTSGSSSGSAAAAAAGLAPLTVGTETDGSIVSPSGMCGVVGFKPTKGTVGGEGIVPISALQDTAGPMTRTVADAAALYRVLSGLDVPATATDLDGLGIAIWAPEGLDTALAGILDSVQTLLRGAGCRLSRGSAAPHGPFADDEFAALVSEFAVELPRYLAGRPGDHPRDWPQLIEFNRSDPEELSRFADEIFVLARTAPDLDSPDYLQARARADEGAARELDSILAGCEYAVTLSNAPAWPIRYGSAEDEHIATSSPAAVTGSPALSLPGYAVEGLPVGITVIGRRGDDAGVLGLGMALERILPPRPEPRLTPSAPRTPA